MQSAQFRQTLWWTIVAWRHIADSLSVTVQCRITSIRIKCMTCQGDLLRSTNSGCFLLTRFFITLPVFLDRQIFVNRHFVLLYLDHLQVFILEVTHPEHFIRPGAPPNVKDRRDYISCFFRICQCDTVPKGSTGYVSRVHVGTTS